VVSRVFEDETPVAWQAMPPHAAVVASDGTEIGVAEKWLGDQEEDIFHGIVVKRLDGKAVEIPARRVKRMTEKHVLTDLAVSEAEALPAYKGS
jgi:hypothetical protein